MFYVVHQLGPKRSFTPEGFLVCLDVPLARTGIQVYAASEVYAGKELPPGVRKNDPMRVERTPEEVFHPRAMASAQGKIFVNEHPRGPDGNGVDVTPDNWKHLAAGHIINPHRGAGAEDDLLLGDLVITDREAIRLVLAGKKELSCGYDAQYEPIGPGHVKQKDIIINHVALVDSGRCGPRCAIGDSAMEVNMAEGSIFDRLRNAFKTRDEAGFEAAVRDADTSVSTRDQNIHLHVGGGPGAKEPEFMHDEPSLAKTLANIDQTLSGLKDGIKTAVHDAVSAAVRTQDRGRGRHDDDRRRHHDAIDKMDCDDDTKNRLHDALYDAEEEEEEEHHRDARRHRDDDDDRHRDDDRRHRRDARRHHRDGEEPPRVPSVHHWGMEIPPGAEHVDAARMHDSVAFEDSFQETVALAEILAPGIRIPAFDGSAKPQKTFDSICKLRRDALTAAYANLPTRGIIESVMPSSGVSDLPVEILRPTFMAAGALMRDHNNKSQQVRDQGIPGRALKPIGGPITSLADYNRRKDEKWAAFNNQNQSAQSR